MKDQNWKGIVKLIVEKSLDGCIKPSKSYGTTDDLGCRSVDNVVHARDLRATMLHVLGIDHTKLTVKYQGLDKRLTGVGKRKGDSVGTQLISRNELRPMRRLFLGPNAAKPMRCFL